MLNLFLSREESDLITEHYQNPQKPGEVFWRLFCDEIDLVFGIKNLEKRDDIANLRNIAKSNFTTNELNPKDEASLKDLLSKIRGFFELKRIDPKSAFYNYDQLKRGKVFRNQFIKILQSQNFLIKDSEVDLLMKKFGDQISNEINYVLLMNLIKEESWILPEEPDKVRKETNENEMYSLPILTSSNNYYTYQTHFKKMNFSKDAYEALEKIKCKVKCNRIRIGQFFIDFDSMRKGSVNKAKFRTALDMAKYFFLIN